MKARVLVTALAITVFAVATASGQSAGPRREGPSILDFEFGESHGCVLRSSGSVWCFGSNDRGQIGSPVEQERPLVPDHVAFGGSRDAQAVQITVGTRHSCALFEGGRAACWGANAAGQLGDGTTADHAVPQDVRLTDAIEEIVAGDDFTCSRSRNGGAVHCWGANRGGVLGSVSQSDSSQPARIQFVPDSSAIAAGGFACVLPLHGQVACWGGSYGPRPVQIADTTGATLVRVGHAHACAIMADQTLRCWGVGDAGQLGNGAFVASPRSAVAVAGLHHVIGLTAGPAHSCAIDASRTVRCWGGNRGHQIALSSLSAYRTADGRGDARDSCLRPTVVSDARGADLVRASGERTCVVTNGRVRCWGEPFGTAGRWQTSTNPHVVRDQAIQARCE